MTTLHALLDSPPQLVVDASPHECPYLPNLTAILPMRLPIRRLTAEEFDACLLRGDRRQGVLLYRPACGHCQACVPIRLDVAAFVPTRGQTRAWRTGLRRLAVRLARPSADAQRARLYNLHKRERNLDSEDREITELEYSAFLVETCADTWELSYWLGEELVGIAVFDRSVRALSAVYCHYNPRVAGLSVGVFSVMQQLELCRQWNLQWLYLGYVVDDCQAMRYKAGYLPHDRLLAGVWTTVQRPKGQN